MESLEKLKDKYKDCKMAIDIINADENLKKIFSAE